MANTLVFMSTLMSLFVVASAVVGVSVVRWWNRRARGGHPSRPLSRRPGNDPGSTSASAESTGPPGTSAPQAEAPAAESADALDRLRSWLEAHERLDQTSPAQVHVRQSSRRVRTRNRTVRLARRHRPAWSTGRSGEPVIRVLGQVEVHGPGLSMTSQQQAVVAMLGIRGPCSRDQLIDGIWAGRLVSESRFANLLAEIRATIGRGRLIQNPDGRYELLDVAVDAERFADLVEPVLAPSRAPLDPSEVLDALDRLELAIGLIDGPVFESDHRRFWGWLDDGYSHRHELEQMVVAAGLRAAVLSLGIHQPQRARWACERCLVAVPHDERLVTTLAGIHLVQGRYGMAADLVAGWEQAVRRLGFGEPSPGPRNRLARNSASLPVLQ